MSCHAATTRRKVEKKRKEKSKEKMMCFLVLSYASPLILFFFTLPLLPNTVKWTLLSLTKHYAALTAATYTVFQSLYISNVRINVQICNKNSFCISRAFKPASCPELPVRWPLATPTCLQSLYGQSETYGTDQSLSTLTYTVNWPCNGGHEMSRLLHGRDCGLCEHNPQSRPCNNLL